MNITAFDLAKRFEGVKEAPGTASNPLVLGMLKMDATWVAGDDVPWCSAFVNFVAWLLGLSRSKSLAAKSWLEVGTSTALADAKVGFDVVVLTRTGGGHVGFYAGRAPNGDVLILGGNQADAVNISAFPIKNIVGVQRLVAA